MDRQVDGAHVRICDERERHVPAGESDSSAGTVRISNPENAKISSRTARRKLSGSTGPDEVPGAQEERPAIARTTSGTTFGHG